MSWFKKTVKKVKKSLRRAAHGHFHLSKADPSLFRKLLPSSVRRRVRTWGSLKKSHRLHFDRLFGGNNSASSISFNSPYTGVGYQYRGKSISELM